VFTDGMAMELAAAELRQRRTVAAAHARQLALLGPGPTLRGRVCRWLSVLGWRPPVGPDPTGRDRPCPPRLDPCRSFAGPPASPLVR
jgi:hypothetical protein